MKTPKSSKKEDLSMFWPLTFCKEFLLVNLLKPSFYQRISFKTFFKKKRMVAWEYILVQKSKIWPRQDIGGRRYDWGMSCRRPISEVLWLWPRLVFFYFSPFEYPIYLIFRSNLVARDLSKHNSDEIGDLNMISPLSVMYPASRAQCVVTETCFFLFFTLWIPNISNI